MAHVQWTREQLLVAFNLYWRTPFGKMHSRNPEIVELATIIGRTPSALAMKLCNIASLDPAEKARKISGLSGASYHDRHIWDEFHSNWEQLALESEEVVARLAHPEPIPEIEPSVMPTGPTEDVRKTRVRLVQQFFRAAVLSSYETRCAVCQISESQLLVASHIIPWAEDAKRRADPTNGLALCALHDKAFDRALISFDESMKLMVSSRLKERRVVAVHRAAFIDLEGQPLYRPIRCDPDPDAIAKHRGRFLLQMS